MKPPTVEEARAALRVALAAHESAVRAFPRGHRVRTNTEDDVKTTADALIAAARAEGAAEGRTKAFEEAASQAEDFERSPDQTVADSRRSDGALIARRIRALAAAAKGG